MKWIKEVILSFKSAIQKIFNFFGYEVTRISGPSVKEKFKVLDEFVDSRGNIFKRLKGYREQIWLMDWDKMIEERKEPNKEAVTRMKSIPESKKVAIEIERFLQIHNLTVVGKNVLEVGCFSGALSYALAEIGADHVDGIDVPENFSELLDGKHDSKAVEEQSRYLARLRETVSSFYSEQLQEKVDFYDADIRNLGKNDCYDLILSSQTLEHIMEPKKAFQQMFSALRPNGFCIHVYGHFFSTAGAHFDGLDFPWGHVRLSGGDFTRYIETYRPEEVVIAKKRFNKTLNRMTLTELRNICGSSGFEILELYHENMGKWADIDQEIFTQCQANYPSLTITDLLAENLWVLLKKPIA